MAELKEKTQPAERVGYKSDVKVTWCPGCGDFGVLSAVYKAFEMKGWDPKDLVVVSGIGCSSRIPYFINSYGFHGIHGRALPISVGMKVSNPALKIVVLGGDGDGFSIGAGHFPHAVRRNPDITYIIMDNNIYGLTKGQSSPTSAYQFVTKASPYGNIEDPINPVAFALVYGASFVAKGFSGKANNLAKMFVEAFDHPGFSFVNVLSPCPTFNKVDTFKYYAERLASVPEEHDASNKLKALELAYRTDKHYMGVYYRDRRPTLEDRLQGIREKVHLDTQEEIDRLLSRFG
jgi:2-oxoglutarate ferredoxin oxidoreductase subunit beta